MASICCEPNGHRRIVFFAGDGSRRTIRLGKVSERLAEGFKVRVENLIGAASIKGNPDPEVAKWITTLDDSLHGRLAAVGLVKSREQTHAKLGDFLTKYFDALTVKPGTKLFYDHVRQNLLDYFGADHTLNRISPEDAEKWKQQLTAKKVWEGMDGKLSAATVGRRVVAARMFFTKAVDLELIPKNPFAKVKGGSQVNKSRQFFITREIADKVLDACPSTQWKLIFSLTRYGALRCPSELLALKWSDVNWEQNRITVHSPKTEHHAGGDMRIMPLFPELHKPLLDAFTEAEPGAIYVVTHAHDASQNLRTQFARIIKRAGLTPWPRLFHNLRSSRQTELCERWSDHVVCAWLGNSEAVARDHYLQVRDEYFEQAAMGGSQRGAQSGAHPAKTECTGMVQPSKFAQKPTFPPPEGGQIGYGTTVFKPYVVNYVRQSMKGF